MSSTNCTCSTLEYFVKLTDESILNVNDDDLIEILLFRNSKFSLERNSSIITASINYIKNSESLFWTKIYVLKFPYYFHSVLFFSRFKINLLRGHAGDSFNHIALLEP